MDESLARETRNLERSWMRHDPAMLRDYLVAGVEDPRINAQSMLSRHFILHALSGERFRELRDQELGFVAAMNWLAAAAPQLRETGASDSLLHALRRGADNAEGLEVPMFICRRFAALPVTACGLTVPNYLESSVERLAGAAQTELPQTSLNLFQELWSQALASESGTALTVLEPACGSANDYRFLDSFGIARLVRYTGFDLCRENIVNARSIFPAACFEIGNAFAINAPDQAYDLCFVHDLFEHLSLAGLETAVREVCRVTRHGICAGFFQMAECPDHVVRPVDDYHWNLLSMSRIRALFAAQGFSAQVLHIGSFLRQREGCEFTHNPNAYTFILSR